MRGDARGRLDPRMRGFWGVVAWTIMRAHFALPLALLLSRQRKRRSAALARVAALMLAARRSDLPLEKRRPGG